MTPLKTLLTSIALVIASAAPAALHAQPLPASMTLPATLDEVQAQARADEVARLKAETRELRAQARAMRQARKLQQQAAQLDKARAARDKAAADVAKLVASK